LQTDGQACRQRYTDKEEARQCCRQNERQTDRLADSEIDRQRGSQTVFQTNREADA